MAFVGDEDAVENAKKELVSLLRARNKLPQGSLDMEPFEVLRDIIRKKVFRHVGGAPQIFKVYEHSNTVPVGVYWPGKVSEQVSVFGRPLMSYEKPNCGVLDPDDPVRAYPIQEQNITTSQNA